MIFTSPSRRRLSAIRGLLVLRSVEEVPVGSCVSTLRCNLCEAEGYENYIFFWQQQAAAAFHQLAAPSKWTRRVRQRVPAAPLAAPAAGPEADSPATARYSAGAPGTARARRRLVSAAVCALRGTRGRVLITRTKPNGADFRKGRLIGELDNEGTRNVNLDIFAINYNLRRQCTTIQSVF